MNAEMVRRSMCIASAGSMWHHANAEMLEENVYMQFGLLTFDERRYNSNFYWMFANGLLTATQAYAMMR